VDSTISEKGLRSLMEANLHIWGGRYNPIVPVSENFISKEWLELITHFDPDYIYYSKQVNLSYLESLGLFYPKEYVEFDDDNRPFHFPGLNIHCLIHEHVHNTFYANKSVLLEYKDNWDMPMPAKDFYQLNLGFKQLFAGENRWTNKVDTIRINRQNVNEINKIVYEQNPYFKSLLSTLHVNSVYMDGRSSWPLQQFEWVVYNKSNFLNDLLYFWNRQLYIQPQNFLSQIISTTGEIEELLQYESIEGLINRLSISNQVFLVSNSVPPSELSEIQQRMQSKCRSTRILTKNMDAFPFEISKTNYIASKHFKSINNLILGKRDFLSLPLPVFENNSKIDDGQYVQEITIERDTKDEHREVKFPYGTSLYHLVCQDKTRITKSHRIAIYSTREKLGTDLSIPTDIEIIRSVLMHREKQNNLITYPIGYLSPSNDGQKVSAFFGIFGKDWGIIRQFLEERFWVNLFKYQSEVKDSAIPPGKGIFSYQDLKSEVARLFEKYLPQITKKLNEGSGEMLSSETITSIVKREKEETFIYYIDDELNYLIRQSALFMGMRVSCGQCGSNKWYSLTELRDKLPCKGCNAEVIPNINSKVYYKLSDTVINNLLSDQTKNGKQYHGNYIVLKTLLFLKNDSRNVGNSFIWSPPLDFSTNNGWSSDLDILAIQNGKLIVGEAKANAIEFTKKVINALIWVGDNLMPDSIIVACEKGNLDEVVEKIKLGMNNKNCDVISHTTYRPWYHFRGIFGLPDN